MTNSPMFLIQLSALVLVVLLIAYVVSGAL